MNHIYRIAIIIIMSCGMMRGQSICLNKLYHHTGVNEPSSSIELGSIVLYLDHYPKMVKTVSKQKNRTEQSFFLPDVEIKTKEVLESIDRINKKIVELKVAGAPTCANDMQCAITITPTTVPQKGLKITLAYDEKHIGISYNRFDSISLQKGVVFRFYNNAIISKIRDSSKPIIQVAYNTPPKIIIDCGHGGTDKGAVGFNDITEKNVNLQVGLQVAQLLKKKNITVCLTRDNDTTLSLDERTTFANKQKADLFVSIHANAASSKQSSGIETYCLSHTLFATDEEDALSCILNKQLGTKYAKSEQLAQSVHQSILSTIPVEYSVKDRRVKHDVAQVLLGTTMPAILVEIGYVTHEQEALLLAQEKYQSFIAHGIVRGIDAYLNHTPSA